MQPSIRSIPQFSVRWTEPHGLVTRTHSLDVQVQGESGARPLIGAVTAHTADNIGPIPAGGAQAETRILRDATHLASVEQLWSDIKADRIEQWIPRADGGDRLGRGEIELVVTRGANDVQHFRTKVGDDTAQPIRDLLASAAQIHDSVRTDELGGQA